MSDANEIVTKKPVEFPGLFPLRYHQSLAKSDDNQMMMIMMFIKSAVSYSKAKSTH